MGILTLSSPLRVHTLLSSLDFLILFVKLQKKTEKTKSLNFRKINRRDAS